LKHRVGIGSIIERRTKRKGTRWYLSFPDVNRHWKQSVAIHATSRSEAIAELRMKLQEIHRQKLGLESVKKISFAEMSDLYLNNYARVNKRSWKGDFYRLQLMKKIWKSLEEITAEEIERYKRERLKAVKRSSINRELSLLRRMLNLAKEWGYLEKQAPKIRQFSEKDNYRQRVLSLQEEERLLAESPLHCGRSSFYS